MAAPVAKRNFTVILKCTMRKDFEVEDAENALVATQELARKQKMDEDRRDMAASRQADEDNGFAPPRKRRNSR